LLCSSTVRCLKRISPPAAFLAMGLILVTRFPSQRTPQKTDTGAAKRDRLKRVTLLSSIKASTIADSRSSFLNFKFSASPPWNLIWEWCLTLSSSRLANRQTTVCFQKCIQTGLRVGCGTSGPTTAEAIADSFWRQTPK
jgi:hypothetical protein